VKNFRKMSDKELEHYINNTTDLKLLKLAEDEHLRRVSTDDETILDGFDELNEYELEFMKKHWRPL